MTDELLNERYALAIERIRQIPAEKSVPQPYRDFFAQMAQYLCKMDQIRSRIAEGYLKTASEEELAVFNREPYEDVIGERYETSYGNPAFAVRALGETHGRSLCCLYRELGNAVVWVYEDRLLELTAAMELYLELYAMFEEETLPSAQYVKESIYWYVSDYAEERQEYQVREIVDPSLHFVKDIVMESDLTDLRYLYQYGEYITENEKGTARFLNTFSQEEIDAMARTYTEGFRKCFLVARKDLSKKKTVSIRFHIGFERMIRAAILQFREMGLEPVISRGVRRTWVAGASANKQYDYDHRNDEALYLNEDLVKRRLRAMQVKYDEYKELAGGYAGPAVVETFGEVPFEPVNKKQALHLNERQQKLRVGFQNEAGQIVNRYIKDDEYGYTIIAYPMPEIDPRYEKIFCEIVKINTLDYEKYQCIQQYLIDALDEGVSVHVLGKGENRTDLRVMLHHLNDPAKETNFENCVADCNIPVGEVFTSPSLTGTTGVLHVTGVYLNELYYRDLCLTLTDGTVEVIDTPSAYPDPPRIVKQEEPFVNAHIYTPNDYVGPLMDLCQTKRGVLVDMKYMDETRVDLHYLIPLGEIVYDFFDTIKSRSRGYASYDYEWESWHESKLVRLDFLLNGEVVDALSMIVFADNAYAKGRRICEKLKENIPRALFEIPVQAAVGGKVIARETVKAMRKDVLAKCYGGDITRKKKLLEKQKEGKKKMRQLGSVTLPSEAFTAVLKLDSDS